MCGVIHVITNPLDSACIFVPASACSLSNQHVCWRASRFALARAMLSKQAQPPEPRKAPQRQALEWAAILRAAHLQSEEGGQQTKKQLNSGTCRRYPEVLQNLAKQYPQYWKVLKDGQDRRAKDSGTWWTVAASAQHLPLAVTNLFDQAAEHPRKEGANVYNPLLLELCPDGHIPSGKQRDDILQKCKERAFALSSACQPPSTSPVPTAENLEHPNSLVPSLVPTPALVQAPLPLPLPNGPPVLAGQDPGGVAFSFNFNPAFSFSASALGCSKTKLQVVTIGDLPLSLCVSSSLPHSCACAPISSSPSLRTLLALMQGHWRDFITTTVLGGLLQRS